MPIPHNIMIHRFEPSSQPQFDDEGDQLLGFYYQLTDQLDKPISDLIGPYPHGRAAERAAQHAVATRDF